MSPSPAEAAAVSNSAVKNRSLPPLILHPFATVGGPDKLIESSRASLMLQGLLPSGDHTTEELDRTLLEGRYSEIVMLFYVGKDLLRWIDQCLECVARDPDLHQNEVRQKGIRYQSFAALLVNQTPETVQKKLRRWGVADYRSIYTRALGLNAVFAGPPDRAFAFRRICTKLSPLRR